MIWLNLHPLLQQYLPHSVFRCRTRALNAEMLPSLLSVEIPLGFRHDSFLAIVYYMNLTGSFCFRICNTQWEVLLSKQVNYNQVVVKCQILQEFFLQNFNMQKFPNIKHSNSRTFQGLSSSFKDLLCFQGLSRAWNFFLQIQGLSKTSQGPYEPCSMLFSDPKVWKC